MPELSWVDFNAKIRRKNYGSDFDGKNNYNLVGISRFLGNDLSTGEQTMNWLMLAVDAVLFVAGILLVYAAANTFEDDGRGR